MISELIIPLIFLLPVILLDLNSPKNRAQRALRGQRIPIKDAKEGELVKIVGKVRLADTRHIAPYSKIPCCYYLISVEQEVSESWEKLVYEYGAAGFYVDDD